MTEGNSFQNIPDKNIENSIFGSVIKQNYENFSGIINDRNPNSTKKHA